VAAAVIALAWPAAAAAQEVPPGSGPDQYIEGVPGAGGNRVPGNGQPGRSTAKLPQAVRKALAREREGRALGRIATDSSLGAPRSGGRGAPRSLSSSGPAHDAVASSATSTFFGSQGGGIAVLAALVLITAAGTLAAVKRARSRRAVR
jgi:hypothetical protein